MSVLFCLQEAAISAQGSNQYTAPDGQVISLTYIADENGYQPQVTTEFGQNILSKSKIC